MTPVTSSGKQEYGDGDTLNALVYVREAHPGYEFSVHQSHDDKQANAQRWKHERADARVILVDSLNGSIHRYFGGRPNMGYIITPDRKVAYRSSWTVPRRLKNALKKVRAGKAAKSDDENFFWTFAEALVNTNVRDAVRSFYEQLRAKKINIAGEYRGVPVCSLAPDGYNYTVLNPAYNSPREFRGPKPGDEVANFTALTVDGQAFRLYEDALDPGRIVVLEFGSGSCPITRGNAQTMQRLG